jgi:ATP-dependent helicase/nuclease subunit B
MLQARSRNFGSEHFRQVADYPGLVSFWWPRFVRIARWIAENEPDLREGVERIAAETVGEMSFDIAGETFPPHLAAPTVSISSPMAPRASSITRQAPRPSAKQVEAGLAPQLTLQAAVLEAGRLSGRGQTRARARSYLHQALRGRSRRRDQESRRRFRHGSGTCEHLAGLKRILTSYADPQQPYYPRAAMEKEEDEGDYDHLSRFREWTLSGDRP